MSHTRGRAALGRVPRPGGASSDRILKVILIGDGFVGKSSLMRTFVDGRFEDSSSYTIGVEFLNKVHFKFDLISVCSYLMNHDSI